MEQHDDLAMHTWLQALSLCLCSHPWPELGQSYREGLEWLHEFKLVAMVKEGKKSHTNRYAEQEHGFYSPIDEFL